MNTRTRLLAAFLGAFAAVGTAATLGQAPAQPGPAATAQPPEAARPRATATDLARAYIELERAFFAAPVERELCREVNTAFDEASLLFFTGDFGRVVQIVKAQTARIMEANALDAGVLATRTAPAMEGRPPSEVRVRVEIAAMMIDAARYGRTEQDTRDDRFPVIWTERHSLWSRVGVEGSIESHLFDERVLGDMLCEEHDIARGRNPYTNRRGDIWRPFFIDDQPAPMRLFCPEAREPPEAGWPLVIALHGAGGNEHMFFAAYGVGRIKQLAEQHGFVVACPQVSPLAAQPLIFDALVDSIALDYPIDRSRIYLVGHSMGAAVAQAWSKGRHDKIAASALIAGAGRLSPRDKLPPTLVIAPELDGLIAAKSIIDNAERAAAAGVKVEVREIKDYGHTLVVGHVLPEVIEWLLKHTSAKNAEAPPRTAEEGAAP